MFINFFRSAFTDEIERVETAPGTAIKDIPFLRNVVIDWNCLLVYVNGFQKDENYILSEDDVCTARNFPSGFWDVMGAVGRVAGAVLSVGVSEAVIGIVDNATKNENAKDITQIFSDEQRNAIQDMINQSSSGDGSSLSQATKKNALAHPEIQGCKNSSALDKPYPFVIGESYFSPYYIGQPYTTVADEFGYRQTYHVLYLLGYNDINVSDISLGLKQIASNSARTRSGSIAVDGFYSQEKYNIKLEIQNSDEVSLYSQKVVQQDINTELLYPAEGSNLKLDEFSSPYPQRVEVEVTFDGLVGKNSDGDESKGTVKVRIEYSPDGGNTYRPFGQLGGDDVSSYDPSTGITTFDMQNYNSMRFVASREFSYNEVIGFTNDVIELRIQRASVHDDDKYLYDTVSLSSIRTWCYDPQKSGSGGLVPMAPMCEKDRKRTTRLAFEITTDELLYDLGEFNCIVHALGRTYGRNSGGGYSWSSVRSETSNPASMALLAMQSPMLGPYVYDDDEIDMAAFGELYRFCDEYDIKNAAGQHVGIQVNGIVSSQQTLSSLLTSILTAGRAVRIFRNNRVSLFIEKPIQTTSFILNNQNVLEASNTKAFDELPSGIRAGFINEDNYYQQDSMYVDFPGAPDRTSVEYKVKSMDFKLQTNVEQIKKNGLFEIARMELRSETWSRKVTSEGCLAFVGALIEIQDDTIAVGIGDGAEVTGLEYNNPDDPTYITAIVTDGSFEVDDTSQTYGIRIQQTDSRRGVVFSKKQVRTDSAGTYSRFVLADPISLNENVVPSIGDILSFGVFEKITTQAICMSKQDNGDGTYDLGLVPYDVRLYDADGGNLPEFRSIVTVPSSFRKEKGKQELTHEDLQKLKAELKSGTEEAPSDVDSMTAVAFRDGIRLSCEDSGNSLPDTKVSYLYEISPDNGTTWKQVKSDGSECVYYFERSVDGWPEAAELSSWTARVKASNIYGVESDNYTVTFVDVSDYGTWIPAPPSELVLLAADRDYMSCRWKWANTSGRTYYGNNNYIVSVYHKEKLRGTYETASLSLSYQFDRTVDDWPEKEGTDGGVVFLSDYSFTVTAVNASSERKSAAVSKFRLDDSRYLTWIPETPVGMTADSMMEGISVLCGIPDGMERRVYGTFSREYYVRYGNEQWPSAKSLEPYKFDRDVDGYPERTAELAAVNSQRVLTEYRIKARIRNVETGRAGNFCADVAPGILNYLTWIPPVPRLEYTAAGRTLSISGSRTPCYGYAANQIQVSSDGNSWYSAGTADPYASEDAWKGEAGGTTEYTGIFSKMMPLRGQTMKAPENTAYSWRVRCLTSTPTTLEPERRFTGEYSAVLETVARANGIKDLVSGAVGTAQLEDGAVTNDKIKARSITAENLNVLAFNKVNSFTEETVGATLNDVDGWSGNGTIVSDIDVPVSFLGFTGDVVSSEFEVLPDEMYEVSFGMSSSGGVSGSVKDYGSCFRWNRNAKTWEVHAAGTGQLTGTLAGGLCYFRTYIIGSQAQISGLPAPSASLGNADIFAVRIKPESHTAALMFSSVSGDSVLVTPQVRQLNGSRITAQQILCEDLKSIAGRFGFISTSAVQLDRTNFLTANTSADQTSAEPDSIGQANGSVYQPKRGEVNFGTTVAVSESEFGTYGSTKGGKSDDNTWDDQEFFHYRPETGDGKLSGFFFKIRNFVVTSVASVISGVFRVKAKGSTDSASFLTVNPTASGDTATGTPANTLRVTGNMSAGGSVSAGGRLYQNGGKSVMGANHANGYWGMTLPDSSDSDWIRTTQNGIIPYQSGSIGDGHQYLGTSSWNFAHAYVDNVHTRTIQLNGKTSDSNAFGSDNPKICFNNADDSQRLALVYTDYDSVQAPSSLTVAGNQGGEYLIAPNIKATGNFYGNLSGNAATANSLKYTGEGVSCVTANQQSNSFNGSPQGDWASYLIFNHGDGNTYFHQMLRLSFFRDEIQLQRRESGTLKGWRTVAFTDSNVASATNADKVDGWHIRVDGNTMYLTT